MYLYTNPSNLLIPGTQHTLGAAHAMEIPYKFDNIGPGTQENHGEVPQPGSIYGMDTMVGTHPERLLVARNMSALWSAFARTGQPAADGQPAWPAYNTQTRATMQINAQCTVVDDPFSQERRLWQHLLSS